MVYVDSRNLGYKPYVWTWLNGRTKETEAGVLRKCVPPPTHTPVSEGSWLYA